MGLRDTSKYVVPFLIAFLGVYVKDVYHTQPSIEDIHFQWSVNDQRFQKIADTFKLNLEQGWERDGAAFVLFYKGEKVLDIWGGYADRESGRLWREDTMNVAFSSTKYLRDLEIIVEWTMEHIDLKLLRIDPRYEAARGICSCVTDMNSQAIGALCVAKLVEQGHISYDDYVANFWPKFAKNGKENVTVQWIMSHMSGLAWTDNEIDLNSAQNATKMAKIFEDQSCQWPPGSHIGYHAFTYGWLVDQLIRRCDPKGRSIGQFWREEFQTKNNLDFYIGLPRELTYRVSRLTEPTPMDTIREYWTQPTDFNIRRALNQWLMDGPLMKVLRNSPWVNLLKVPLNNPELFQLEQTAFLGIGTSRSMAEIFEKLRSGRLFNKDVTKKLTTPYAKSEDIVTGANVARGQGLMFGDYTHNGKTYRMIGHAGYGGQNVRLDFDNEITLAYMSNGLKVGFGDTARTYKRIISSLYDTLEELRK